MAVESFEVAQQDEYGDLLNRPRKKEPLKVGVYTSAYFEYYRMYPRTLESFVNADVAVVMDNLRTAFGEEARIVWPGTVTTMDQADAAGRLFKSEAVDLVVFVMFTYTVDVISMQCLRYVENTPLLLFLRQSHRDIDFKGNYEQTLRNSAMISATQLTGTFKKMGIFPRYEVVVGTDTDPEAYAQIRRYFNAVRARLVLRDLSLGMIGHVFRGMYDHEFDRTRIAGALGPQVIDIQVSHLLDTWEIIVPMWDYSELAAGIGTEEQRAKVKATVRDLRVPLYDTRLMFVRKTDSTERLFAEYNKELSAGMDDKLAFLLALYRVKPFIMPTPLTWTGRSG